MKTFFHSVDSAKMMVNGKIVRDAMMDTRYEGDGDGNKNKLTIDTYNKGKRNHIELDNKDIMKILSQPASAMSLEKRLTKDFSIKKNKSIRKSIKYKSIKYKSKKSKKSKKNKK